MPKILIAECKQEVSTFNPFLSQYEDFSISQGDDLLAFHRGGALEVAGALSVFDNTPGVELVPTYSARSITSGGTLSAAGFERLARELLESIRNTPAVDGVYFSMHGAMAAANELDPEGYLLQAIRKILGEDIPIVISMDLHGIFTDRMAQHVNALTAFHTYPHVDFYDTGVRAARLLLRIMSGDVQPVIAKVAVPTLVRGDELITETGLFGQSIKAAQALEQTETGLAAGMFIGNPFTDVPELQTYSFVITNNDPEMAEGAALKLATDFWEVRDRLQSKLIALADAVDIALATGEGTLAFTDAADATSSGASGDSNAILRALVEADYKGKTLIPIVDPPAVEAAFAAGIGGIVNTTVGGQLDPRFEPLPIVATVRLLADGDFVNESHGSVWHAGKTAVLESTNHTLVVTSRAVSLYDRSLFLAHGQDPRRFDLVVVKSPHCQPQFFDNWVVKNLNVDAPGSTSANLPTLGHTVCPRPIYPLDDDFEYAPYARIIRR